MKSKKDILDNLINNMVYVEGGTFMMGATPEQGEEIHKNEKPVHQVTLSSFYIGKYEVTQEEWQAVMGYHDCAFKGAKKAVNMVNWEKCQQFISMLNQLTGRTFRLPTEAEWEYAARGGQKSKGYKFAGSNSIDEVAWHDGNSNHTIHNIGQKLPNELGLYDMCGNVWEWCQDYYGGYVNSPQTNPTGPSYGGERVIRGGCIYASSCRLSDRDGRKQEWGSKFHGLRLVLEGN